MTFHQVVASERDMTSDDLWTVSSDYYIPRSESESSDNGEDCKSCFHREERLEVHWQRRLAAREYEHFAV